MTITFQTKIESVHRNGNFLTIVLEHPEKLTHLSEFRIRELVGKKFNIAIDTDNSVRASEIKE